MIVLPFCPRCGNAVEPDKKFCTSCGTSLTPDGPAPVPETGGLDYSAGGSATSGPRIPPVLFAAAGLVVLLLVIAFVIYPMFTGSGILSAAGKPATPAPTPVPTGLPGGSYVIVETETPTPVPTPLVPATTIVSTTIITTRPTVTEVPEYLICAADRVKCDNQCVDILTDGKNCGYCGTACLAGQFCSQGTCIANCSAGLTSCQAGCFDLQTNPRHCGSCTNSCQTGLICIQGWCNSPTTIMPVPQ